MLLLLFYLCLFSSSMVKPVNIQKLCQSSFLLKNQINSDQKIRILFSEKCDTCSERYHVKNVTVIHSAEEKVIKTKTKNGIIDKIYPLETECRTFFLNKKVDGIYVLNIEKYRNDVDDFPIHTAFGFEKNVNTNNSYMNSWGPVPYCDGISEIYVPPAMQMAITKKINRYYEKNNLSEVTLYNKNEHKIPKIIHQIWVGQSIYPKLFRQWTRIWRKCHPGWKYVLWTEKLLTKFFANGLVNQRTFDTALYEEKNYAKAADVARYEIINKFGGLYADTDVLCFESFELLHYVYDFYAMQDASQLIFWATNGHFGAIQNHPILINMIHFIKQFEDITDDVMYHMVERPENTTDAGLRRTIRGFKTIHTTGPVGLTHAIYNSIDDGCLKNIIFPSSYAFANLDFIKPNVDKKLLDRPECFCFHDIFLRIKKSWNDLP
ncbi:MAG: glycosyltransferase [bacterium]